MSIELNAEEARVLGVLIEKDMATPDYYPMSLNALVNGCNQKNNRDPVVAYTEDIVRETLDSLRSKQLASVLSGGGNRVVKWSHRGNETLSLTNPPLAVIAVLLLRGPQTVNEIKTRTESLNARLDDLESTEAVLQRLAERGMVVLLPKLTGMREPRWMHLLCGPVDATLLEARPEARHDPRADAAPAPVRRDDLAERVAQLESEVAELKAEATEIKTMFAAFRRQFE